MSKILYERIAEQIMLNILEENYKPGDKYKSVREIAILFTVNPKTVQRAFDHLSSIGIFETVVGGGRYISSDPQIINNINRHLVDSEVNRFISKMNSYNLSESQVIEIIKDYYKN